MAKAPHKVKLTRVASSHRNLRTDFVVGECFNLPRVGSCFFMWGPPLDPTAGSERQVETTPVKTVTGLFNGATRFTTQNSTYDLEILDAEPDELR